MAQLTPEYLKQLGACWSTERLQKAAQSWPQSPTWTWFLGDRLDAFDHGECMLRVHCAVAHVAREKLRVPAVDRLGQLTQLARELPVDLLRPLCKLLGRWIDAPDDADADDALRAFITAQHEAEGAEPV